jgi:hypothetical protein
MAEPKCPPIDAALIRFLEHHFPHRSPKMHEEHGDLMWRGGQRSVVDMLLREYNRQDAHD